MNERIPTISICLTTYNRGHILHETIESILNQSFTDFELIISNDNSSDNTEQVCLEYAAKDSRVKYHRNEVNLKMPGNLNAAISKAKGKFVANLHDGDVYRLDLIEKWYDVICLDPEVIFVFNQYMILDETGNKVQLIDHKLSEINEGFKIREYFYKHQTSAPWGTVMARRDAYSKYGFFNSKYGFISDVEMWMRLSKFGKVGYVEEPLIELSPRERTHNYFLPHESVTFNNFLILYEYFIQENQTKIKPSFIKQRIQIHLIKSLLIIFKHREFSRFSRFWALANASPFTFVRIFCFPFIFILKIISPENQLISLPFEKKMEWRKICSLKLGS